MTCTIVGTRRVDMANDNIHGFSLFVTREEDGVNGLIAEKHFLNDEKIGKDLAGVVPSPGNIMEFEFNSRGKIGRIKELA